MFSSLSQVIEHHFKFVRGGTIEVDLVWWHVEGNVNLFPSHLGYVCICGDMIWQVMNVFLMFLFLIEGSKKGKKRKKSLQNEKKKS